MQSASNIASVVIVAFCLALAVAGCGQKDNSSTPPPAGTPAIPNTMPPGEQAMHAHPATEKPH